MHVVYVHVHVLYLIFDQQTSRAQIVTLIFMCCEYNNTKYYYSHMEITKWTCEYWSSGSGVDNMLRKFYYWNWNTNNNGQLKVYTP
jgi:hypothetical protein